MSPSTVRASATHGSRAISSFHSSRRLLAPFFAAGDAGVPSYSTSFTAVSGAMSFSFGSTASSAASSLARRAFQRSRWIDTLVLSRRSTSSLVRASIFEKRALAARRRLLFSDRALASQLALLQWLNASGVVLLQGIE